MPRPSEPLLAMLRQVAKRKGLNTAALALAADVPRARLKHVLAGTEPLTVDELVALSQALELSAEDLTAIGLQVPAGMSLEDAPSEDALSEDAEAPPPTAPALHTVGRRERPPVEADPFGNHAEQIVRLGFGLGIDLFLVLHAGMVAESGVPRTTLARFTDLLPIKLDAAFHRHYDPRYLPEGLQLTLSFDALYTCVFPWAAIAEVRMVPLPPEPPDEPEEPEEPKSRRGHLRLID